MFNIFPLCQEHNALVSNGIHTGSIYFGWFMSNVFLRHFYVEVAVVVPDSVAGGGSVGVVVLVLALPESETGGVEEGEVVSVGGGVTETCAVCDPPKIFLNSS